MIIIQKIFNQDENNPLSMRDSALDFYRKQEQEREYRKGASEYLRKMVGMQKEDWTKTNLSDPTKKEDMVRSDMVNDALERLKGDDWKLTFTKNNNEEATKTPEVTKVIQRKEQPVHKTPQTQPTPEITITAEKDILEDTGGEGLSNSAKLGLAAAGIAAVGAGSYAAYKAWKKRKARKAAVDAEVNEFLEGKYKTKK